MCIVKNEHNSVFFMFHILLSLSILVINIEENYCTNLGCSSLLNCLRAYEDLGQISFVQLKVISTGLCSFYVLY